VILTVENVSGLQRFLLDATKRYVVPRTGSVEAAADLLTAAASLDYVLVLASEQSAETLVEDSPIASGVRETLARAAHAALSFVEAMLQAPPEIFEDFAVRHLQSRGIFDVLRALRDGGALNDGEVAFRDLTLRSEVKDRA